MTDYLGPLSIGSSGTYILTRWDSGSTGTSTITVEVIVRSTTADLLAVALEALVAQLYSGGTWVHYQPGVTNPVVYNVAGITDFKQDALVSWPVFWQRVSFTFVGTPRPSGALTTVYTATSVLTPASKSLSTLLGTHPTGLDVTVHDTSGNNMHSVWCALAPTVLTDAKWRVYASALTWTGMAGTGGADTAMWNNDSKYLTSTTAATAPLDTSTYPAGKYRLLARVKQAAGVGYVRDSQNDTWVAVTRTTPHLVVVGDLDLPVADTVPGTAANLTLGAKSDGTNRLDLNAFVLMPLDWGYWAWHPDSDTTELHQIDVGPTGTYMDSACDTTYFQGGTLVARILAAHVGTLVATPQPTGSSWPTDWTSENATADTNRFKMVGTSRGAYYATTVAATPLVVPGAWYELSFTRDVDSWVSGSAKAIIWWRDVDGNTVRSDTLSTASANDASPTAVTVYAKAPAHAARASVRFETTSGADLTVYFSAAVLRRCPLNLIVVVEDAAGALSSNTHAVALTVRHTAKYEIAR